MPPKITVGDHAGEPARAIDHADAAEALRRHGHDNLAHRRLERDQRQGLAFVHEVGHVLELGAERAAGVVLAEIMRREALLLEQRNRQTVAESKLHRGRGRRRQAVRAGLLRLGQLEHHVGGLAERRVLLRGDGDEAHREAARVGDDVRKLDRLAGPRQRQDDVVARHHAEVAVRGLGRVHEEGWRAGRGEGRRNLLADMA